MQGFAIEAIRPVMDNIPGREKKQAPFPEAAVPGDEPLPAAGILLRANRQLVLMTGAIRHDIRNKLLVLHGNLALMKEQIHDPSHAVIIGELERTATAIGSAIERTRLYEKFGSQLPRWIDLGKIAGLLEVPASVPLRTSLDGVAVYTNPLIGEVFRNLLDNSLRHGEKVTKIDLTSSKTPQGLVVVWEDNGIGIPGEMKERIFTRGVGKNGVWGFFWPGRSLPSPGAVSARPEPRGAEHGLRLPSRRGCTARSGWCMPRRHEQAAGVFHVVF